MQPNKEHFNEIHCLHDSNTKSTLEFIHEFESGCQKTLVISMGPMH